MQRHTVTNQRVLMAVESSLFLIGMIILMLGTIDDRLALMHTGAIVMSIALVVMGGRTIRTSTHPWLRRAGHFEIAAAIVLLIIWFIWFAR